MHVSVQKRQSSKDQKDREALLHMARDAFSERPAMRYTDLRIAVKKLLAVKDRTAERKLARMKALAVIVPVPAGLYAINRPAVSQ